MTAKRKRLYVRDRPEVERRAVDELSRIARASNAPTRIIPVGYSTRRRRAELMEQSQSKGNRTKLK
jgi:hypothetical protein